MTTPTRATTFGDLLSRFEEPGRADETTPIRVEEFVHDGHYVVRAELPGVDPDSDIDVRIDGDLLTIRGRRQETRHEHGRSEFRYGSFARSLRLPLNCEEHDITATYDAGVLEVTLPMLQAPTSIVVPVQRAGAEAPAAETPTAGTAATATA